MLVLAAQAKPKHYLVTEYDDVRKDKKPLIDHVHSGMNRTRGSVMHNLCALPTTMSISGRYVLKSGIRIAP